MGLLRNVALPATMLTYWTRRAQVRIQSGAYAVLIGYSAADV